MRSPRGAWPPSRRPQRVPKLQPRDAPGVPSALLTSAPLSFSFPRRDARGQRQRSAQCALEGRTGELALPLAHSWPGAPHHCAAPSCGARNTSSGTRCLAGDAPNLRARAGGRGPWRGRAHQRVPHTSGGRLLTDP